jgi:hypothetical protein
MDHVRHAGRRERFREYARINFLIRTNVLRVKITHPSGLISVAFASLKDFIRMAHEQEGSFDAGRESARPDVLQNESSVLSDRHHEMRIKDNARPVPAPLERSMEGRLKHAHLFLGREQFKLVSAKPLE